ncbi:MAG: hypothetical protein AB8I08_29795 [Sandaracinaceae bacterium]
MTPFLSASDLDDDFIPVSRTFREASEARHTPSREELLSAELLLDDEDDELDAPEGMTGNESFRIIETIKEREAALREAA